MRSEFGSVCLGTENEVNSPYYRQVRTDDYEAWNTLTGVEVARERCKKTFNVT